MKQKIIFLLLCMFFVFSMNACGKKSRNVSPKDYTAEQQYEKTDDLTGTWVSKKEDDLQLKATITEDTISIHWLKEKTKTIYWIGTYIAPEEPVSKYEWTSIRDKEQTKTALLASTDESKVFQYTNGTLVFNIVTSQGTSTVKMSKE